MWAEGHSFFMYRSDSVDSLASCCRLKNEIQDNQFSYTLGAGGISTGSKCVMTMNINRIVQEVFQQHPDWNRSTFWDLGYGIRMTELLSEIAKQVSRIHKYLKSFNTILMDRYYAGLLPLYNAGFVDPNRQYLTVGIQGLVEAAEYLGCAITSDGIHYKQFVNNVLNAIHTLNKEDRTKECMFNCEYVPKQVGHFKPFLIDLKLSRRQQGASVIAA